MPLIETPPEEVQDYFPPSLREKYVLAGKIEQLKLSKHATPAQIGWEPNWDDFQQRSEQLQAKNADKSEKNVPSGWPRHLPSHLAWRGEDLNQESAYVYEISGSDKEEIIRALAICKDRHLTLGDINRSTFHLPSLHAKLEAISKDIHSGFGFFVVRGWQSAEFSQADNAIVFVGISSYIAEKRGRQNQRGMMLTHITDIAPIVTSEVKLRSAYSNVKQPFHSDLMCGVLALFCQSPAAEGGETRLASSWNIYNELAASRPDIIHVLQNDNWVHDTHGRDPPYHYRPLLHLNENSKPILIFSRRVLTGSRETPRTAGIPPLSEEQAEALDALHLIASKHCIEIKQQAGDMLFVNNFAILHSRKSFTDSEVAKRYFMRLWLYNEEQSWTLPESLQLPWDRIFAPLHNVRDYWDADPFKTVVDPAANLPGPPPPPPPPPPVVYSTSCG
ncbi:hypothetical protein LLEC1_07584 [Akanthomyces lecanii]|uniref:TauD/TfdA-like domain-containing protein n=1 Tax=Cordyceps confragosa TaxID=2714763 RepID=A0A179III7_CORDF|nr:hypothetical protein LLEC1_07584 [Akanthomyces lecanii]